MYGARPLRRAIQSTIADQAAGMLLDGSLQQRRCRDGGGARRKNCFDENARTWYDNVLNAIWTEAYPNMAQNMQTENKAVYLDPFRYNQFEGFNSHNHVVVTEVGEGTSVVEVEMTQDGMNPLNMAHGGLIFTLCDVATGVAVRTGGRITVTLDSSIHFLRAAKDTPKLVAHGRVVKEGRTTGLAVTAEVFNAEGKLHCDRGRDGLLCGREHVHRTPRCKSEHKIRKRDVSGRLFFTLRSAPGADERRAGVVVREDVGIAAALHGHDVRAVLAHADAVTAARDGEGERLRRRTRRKTPPSAGERARAPARP
ncbi:MAG: hotdog fold thioesterase [Oscillospiraceae bacterium]